MGFQSGLGFSHRQKCLAVEHLHTLVKQFITEPSVETLDEPVLPRAAGVDELGRDLCLRQEIGQIARDELAAVVTAQSRWAFPFLGRAVSTLP